MRSFAVTRVSDVPDSKPRRFVPFRFRRAAAVCSCPARRGRAARARQAILASVCRQLEENREFRFAEIIFYFAEGPTPSGRQEASTAAPGLSEAVFGAQPCAAAPPRRPSSATALRRAPGPVVIRCRAPSSSPAAAAFRRSTVPAGPSTLATAAAAAATTTVGINQQRLAKHRRAGRHPRSIQRRRASSLATTPSPSPSERTPALRSSQPSACRAGTPTAASFLGACAPPRSLDPLVDARPQQLHADAQRRGRRRGRQDAQPRPLPGRLARAVAGGRRPLRGARPAVEVHGRDQLPQAEGVRRRPASVPCRQGKQRAVGFERVLDLGLGGDLIAACCLCWQCWQWRGA